MKNINPTIINEIKDKTKEYCESIKPEIEHPLYGVEINELEGVITPDEDCPGVYIELRFITHENTIINNFDYSKTINRIIKELDNFLCDNIPGLNKKQTQIEFN